MATNDSSSNTGIVAIMAILVLVAAGLFFAFQGGLFGGGGGSSTDVNVDLPDVEVPAAPAPSKPGD